MDDRAAAHDHRRYGYWSPTGRFQELLRIEGEGIVYRNRVTVPWGEIAALRAYPDFDGDLILGRIQPRLRIYLRNGRALMVRGAGLSTDCRECSKPRRVEGLRAAYVEAVRLLRSNGIADWRGPREERLLLRLVAALAVPCVVAAYALARYGILPATRDALEWAGDGIAVAAILAVCVAPLLGRAVRRHYLATVSALYP